MASPKTLALREINANRYYPPLIDKEDARIQHTFGGTYLRTQHGQLLNIGAEANGRTKKRIKKYKAKLIRKWKTEGGSSEHNDTSSIVPSPSLGLQEGSRA